MAQSASKNCEVCIAAPGLHYCSQCQQLFCGNCKTMHLRTKSSNNHSFLSATNLNIDVKIYCDEHSESLRFQCLQCSTPVCDVCIVNKHNKHELVQIRDSVASLQSEVSKIIHTKIDGLKSDVNKIKKGTETYKNDIETILKKIRAEGNAIKSMVDKKVESLIKTLKDKDGADSISLNELDNFFGGRLETGRKYQQKFDEIQKSLAEVAQFQKLKDLKAEVETIKPKQIPKFPSVNYTQRTVTDSDIDNLFGSLSLL